MNKLMDAISDNVTSVLHLVNTFCLKIKFYNDKRKFEDAVCTARIILEKIGESIYLKPVNELDITRTKNLIVGNSNEELYGMKLMENERSLAILRILDSIVTSSYFTNPTLNESIGRRIVELSFQHGISKFSPLGLVGFGQILCRKKDKLGFRFGLLGLHFAEKNQAKEVLIWGKFYKLTLMIW